MTVKKRRLIFGFFSLLFLVAGTFVVLYSLGWRVNFDNFRIQKTGAIAIKTTPRDITIKINNKIYADKSNIIQRETLISNLLPKTYKIEIAKEGYLPYKKNLLVEPAMVSRLLGVLLVPKEIKNDELFSVKGLKIHDTISDASKFIVYNEEKDIYYLYNISEPQKAQNLNVVLSNIRKATAANEVFFIPFKPENLLVDDSGFLKIFDTSRQTVETIEKGPLIAWQLEGANIYLIKKTGSKNSALAIYSYSLVFKSEKFLVEITMPDSGFNKIKASDSGNYIAFSDKSGGLYLLNRSKNITEKIAHNAKDFSFALDNKKLAILDKDGKISVYYLENFDFDTRKKAGDVTRLDLDNKKLITNIFWHKNSIHVFAVFNDNEIKIVEIDDRLPLNIYKIADGFSDIYYHKDSNALYLTRDDTLRKIKLEQ